MKTTNYTFEPTPLEEITPRLQEIHATQAFVWRRDDADADGNVPPDFVYQLLADFDAECFTLRETKTDTFAGFISIFPGEDAHQCDIGPLYIRPAYRGQGLGKYLIHHALEWARSRHIKMMFIATWGKNHRARHLFESTGFVLIKETPNARVNGDSTVKYTQTL